MTDVILTHAPEAAARAEKIARKLAALGYKVRADLDADAALSPHGRRRLAADIDKAAVVLVLWSKDAANAPALIEAASRAKAKGKLALARLDTAAPALGRAVDLSNWTGRDTRPWLSLVASLRAKAAPATPSGRKTASAPAPLKAAADLEQVPTRTGYIMAWLLLIALLGGLGFAGNALVQNGTLKLPF